MAKPIRAIPELTGKDAERFVKRMIARQNSKPTKKELELHKRIQSFNLRVL